MGVTTNRQTGWLRLAASIAFVCLSAAAQVFAQLPAKPYIHAPSGVIFPQTIAGVPCTGFNNFDQQEQGLGISVRYESKGYISFEVFVYDLNLDRIPEYPGASLFREHYRRCVQQIVQLPQQGLYNSASILLERDSTFVMGQGHEQVLLRTKMANFRLRLAGVDYISVLYLAAVNNHFVKLRATYPVRRYRRAEQLLKPFLVQWADLTAHPRPPAR